MERLEQLLSQALDGELNADERTELNTILRSHADARRTFHRYMDLHTELEWMLNPDMLEIPLELNASPSAASANVSQRAKLIAGSGWLALAAALAVLLLIKTPDRDPAMEPSFAAAPSKKAFVARANYSGDARLGSASSVERHGEWVSLGKIILEKGTLGLTFDSGARVVLNAPAEFDLDAANRGFLHYGQAVAQVPEPATGFIINTPNSTLVDLGTEFTVNVESNQSSVKVIDGEVRAYAETREGKSEERLLHQDQAVHIGQTTSEAFSPADDFTPTVFHDWTRFYEPDADYVHFTFENNGYEVLSSSAWGNATQVTPQTVNTDSGARPKTRVGVFGEALRFNGKDAYLSTTLEGISGDHPRTVVCWIKVPPKQHDSAISIVSWGQPSKGKRWQVGINQNTEWGTLGGLRTDFSYGYVTGSTDLRDGRWHHIASVYIGGNSPDIAAHIRHYVDGKLEAVSGFSKGDFPVNTRVDENTEADNLTIGYRNIGNRREIRTFYGSIDELYLFDAAILPSQIFNLKTRNQLAPQ
jgi:ferric-dicitrate binding protein FerR (iron transport regulator)